MQVAASSLRPQPHLDPNRAQGCAGYWYRLGGWRSGHCTSQHPGSIPSQHPGSIPSQHSGSIPSQQPGSIPSQHPGSIPSQHPGSIPSQHPGSIPSQHPWSIPSQHPWSIPSQHPWSIPNRHPWSIPSHAFRNVYQYRCTGPVPRGLYVRLIHALTSTLTPILRWTPVGGDRNISFSRFMFFRVRPETSRSMPKTRQYPTQRDRLTEHITRGIECPSLIMQAQGRRRLAPSVATCFRARRSSSNLTSSTRWIQLGSMQTAGSCAFTMKGSTTSGSSRSGIHTQARTWSFTNTTSSGLVSSGPLTH